MSHIEKLAAACEDPSVVELMINPDGSVYGETARKGVRRLDAALSEERQASDAGGPFGE